MPLIDGATAIGSRPTTTSELPPFPSLVSLPSLSTRSQPPRTPIPIRVRLAIVRTNSFHPEADEQTAADEFPSFEASPLENKIETYCPPLALSDGGTASSTASDDGTITIADLTQYIVEELFIQNKEAHFLGHHDESDESKFLSILLGRSGQEGWSVSLPGDKVVFTFDYGMMKQTTRQILVPPQQKLQEAKREVCFIHFTLMEEAEGYPVEISPSVCACGILRMLLSSSQNSLKTKKVDLTLKAHVVMCPSSAEQTNREATSTKRKIVLENADMGGDKPKNAKRSNIEKTGKESTLFPGPGDGTISKYPNGIPSALVEAWEDQNDEIEVDPLLTYNAADQEGVHGDGDIKERMGGKGGKKKDPYLTTTFDSMESILVKEEDPTLPSSPSSSSSTSDSDQNSEEMVAAAVAAVKTDEDTEDIEKESKRRKSSSNEKSKSSLSSDQRKEDGTEEGVEYTDKKKQEAFNRLEKTADAATTTRASKMGEDDSEGKNVTAQIKAAEEGPSSAEKSSSSESSNSNSSSENESHSLLSKEPDKKASGIARRDDDYQDRVLQDSDEDTVISGTQIPITITLGKAREGGSNTGSLSSTTRKMIKENKGTNLPSSPTPAEKMNNLAAASNNPSLTQQSAMVPTVLLNEFNNIAKVSKKGVTNGSEDCSSKEEIGDDDGDESSSRSSLPDDDSEEIAEEEKDNEDDTREEEAENKSLTTKEATMLKIEQVVTPPDEIEDDGNEKPQQLYPLTKLRGEDEEAKKGKPANASKADKEDEEDEEDGSSSSSSSSSSDGSSSDSSSSSSEYEHDLTINNSATYSDSNKPQQLYPLTQLSNESVGEEEERSEPGSGAKMGKPNNGSKAANIDKNDESSINSSSSSSSGSCSSSSTSSSSDDSSTSSSSSSSDSKEDEGATNGVTKNYKEEEETIEEVNMKSPSLLPVIRSSRGGSRRRTPLVSRTRKIVINTPK